MKKLFVLSIAILFALVGAQAFASPPIKPPIEGFIITSETLIDCVGTVTESESYNWRYFEGEGMLMNENVTLSDAIAYAQALYKDLQTVWGPNAVPPGPLRDLTAQEKAFLALLDKHGGNAILIQNLGFQEGAEITYKQDFKGLDGTTHFDKKFKAVSKTDATTPNNLTVDKTISFDNLGGTGKATHEEKVAMSVVSVGSKGGDIVQDASSLLTLCPWAGGNPSNTGTIPGYPPTNEGIAAGSKFDVSQINFTSNTKVNTSDNPALSYSVVADGVGSISAGFVVDLFEGKPGDVWGTYQPHQPWIDLYNNLATIHGLPTFDHPDPVWVAEGEPMLASRTNYVEHASANGVWSFSKKVGYTSTMPGATTASSLPINNVP